MKQRVVSETRASSHRLTWRVGHGRGRVRGGQPTLVTLGVTICDPEVVAEPARLSTCRRSRRA